MMNTNTTTETRNVTAKELAQRFEGKYVDITPYDRYGMSITMTRATVESQEGTFPDACIASCLTKSRKDDTV